MIADAGEPSDLLWGALSGDMEALTVLFVLLIPVVFIGVGIKALLDKRKGGGR